MHCRLLVSPPAIKSRWLAFGIKKIIILRGRRTWVIILYDDLDLTHHWPKNLIRDNLKIFTTWLVTRFQPDNTPSRRFIVKKYIRMIVLSKYSAHKLWSHIILIWIGSSRNPYGDGSLFRIPWAYKMVDDSPQSPIDRAPFLQLIVQSKYKARNIPLQVRFVFIWQHASIIQM